MPTKSVNLIFSPRLLALWFLGFASGFPAALTGSTLQAWFTTAHINVVTIGALSLLGIPYTLKFLWAPIMDHYRLPWLGKRIGWIVLMQIGMVITLFVLSNMHPETQASMMGVVAFMIAFFSASQDVSITAYQTDILEPAERGMGVAYYIFAYRVATLVTGGLALIFAEYIGWRSTYLIMAGILSVNTIITILSPRPVELSDGSKNLYGTISAALRDLLTREKIIPILLFIFLYKVGDALALQLMTNFLLHGLGFSLAEVGVAYKMMSMIAIILGALAGGVLLSRWTLYRGLLVFGLAQTFSTLTFVVLSLVGKQFFLMAISLFIENFCSGLSTAALLAFMMSLCNHRYTATQFALLSAFASLGRVFLGPIAGVLVANLGWTQFFLYSFLLSFPGIFLLLLLKNRMTAYVPATAE